MKFPHSPPAGARHTYRALSHPKPHLLSNATRIPRVHSQTRALTTTCSLHAPPNTSPSRAPPAKSQPSAAHRIIGSYADEFEERSAGTFAKAQPKSGGASSALNAVANHIAAQKADIERQATRRWDPGDVYRPADLGPMEMQKWKFRRRPGRDVFDMLGLDPLDEWKNPVMMSEFMTRMGRIRHSKETGLRPVNQRKVAKAIRRAVGMGFLPSVHVHPEMLRRDGPWQYL